MCMDHAVALTAGKSLYTAHKNSYNVDTSLASCWDDMTRCALPHSQHVERQQQCTRRLLFKFCLSLVNVHVNNQPNNETQSLYFWPLFNSANCKWKTHIWLIKCVDTCSSFDFRSRRRLVRAFYNLALKCGPCSSQSSNFFIGLIQQLYGKVSTYVHGVTLVRAIFCSSSCTSDSFCGYNF